MKYKLGKADELHISEGYILGVVVSETFRAPLGSKDQACLTMISSQRKETLLALLFRVWSMQSEMRGDQMVSRESDCSIVPMNQGAF